MKVSELGEFGLIELLAKMAHVPQANQTSWQRLLIGIGNDAAAWRGDSATQLATTDSLIQDIHFPSGVTTWEDVGWRALAANLSDIAAMGGVPQYALIALALPGNTEVEDITDLYRGMIELARKFGVAIIGGDISSAPLIVITITVLGNTLGEGKGVLARSAAKPGEQVVVTGELGGAAAGLKMLTEQLQFDSWTTALLKKVFLRPHPRIAEGQLLVAHKIKTAIDISDGLVADLSQICKSSQVSAKIDIDRVPIAPVVKSNFGDKSMELALSGGEDYELLFTGGAGVIDRMKRTIPCPITVIGEIIADKRGEVTLVDSKGNPFYLRKSGWEHFRSR